MVVDTIATSTSLIAHQLFNQRSKCKNIPNKAIVSCRPLVSKFVGRRLIACTTSTKIPRPRPGRFADTVIKALAMEVTKEANPRRDYRGIPSDGINPTTSWPPPNKADDPRIHNPLLRLERMGCGWVGVIFEWEGVIVEDDPVLEKQAWVALSQEEGKSPPPAFVLRRMEGMKNEQAISEVLCWSRDPTEIRRLASHKEEIHKNLRGGAFHQMRSGSRDFMCTLVNYKIPLAIASTRPRKVLEEAIEAVGAQSFFSVIVAAEDVFRGKPDPEMFVYAAQLMGFIPERCIVFGNCNSAVEAAHEVRMKCVAVASKHPVYELNAADLVVRRLDELSVVDLKNLADIDSPEFDSGEPEPEMEEEEEFSPSSSVGVDDISW